MTRIAKTTGLPDRRGEAKVRHGDARVSNRHPLYKTWAGIMRRCYNPNEKNYERYGARGIRVCARWIDYVNFKADMIQGWEPGLSIERIDNSGNYAPENCMWATRKQQCRNRRSNRTITYNGQTKTLVEWGECLGIPWARFYQRIFKLGWSIDRAMTEPARPRAPFTKKHDGNLKLEEMKQ